MGQEINIFGLKIDAFWLVLAGALFLLILLVSRYTYLVNLAHRKKTEWVKVYDRQIGDLSYEHSVRFSVYGARNLSANGRVDIDQYFSVTFQKTDGTFMGLQVTEDEFKRCTPFSMGQLTYRGEDFIHYAPEIPTPEIQALFPDEGDKKPPKKVQVQRYEMD